MRVTVKTPLTGPCSDAPGVVAEMVTVGVVSLSTMLTVATEGEPAV